MAKNLNPNNIKVGDFVTLPDHPAYVPNSQGERVWQVTSVQSYGACIVRLVSGTNNQTAAASLASVKKVEN